MNKGLRIVVAVLFVGASVSAFADEQDNICEDKAEESACWIELERTPGCYVWRQDQQVGDTANWSGSCAEGKVEGKGVLTWKKAGKWQEISGTANNGKLQGVVVIGNSDGVRGQRSFIAPVSNAIVLTEQALDELADLARSHARQVSAARESYERTWRQFAYLVNSEGASHWSTEIRTNTWFIGGAMVNDYEKWEQAVEAERDFRESAGLDNPQYERNKRNLANAKQIYTELIAAAQDQTLAAGYDAP